MLRGFKNYFSLFGILLFSVNTTLLAEKSKLENLIKTAFIMIEAFLRKELLKPILIQQKHTLYY